MNIHNGYKWHKGTVLAVA